MDHIPRVGVGAVILDDHHRVLLVLRKKPPEAGCWSLPGGKVEFMETIEDAVVREMKEELGIKIKIERLLCVTNHIVESEAVHWVAPTFIAKIVDGEVKNLEPHALQKVEWFPIEEIPDQITITTNYALSILKHNN